MIKLHFILISNNPQVNEKFGLAEMVDGSILKVLVKARDYIHKGHRLLTHPLAGSIKPNETLYRSILITREPNQGNIDFKSLELIENAIITHTKFQNLQYNYSESILRDFQGIDLDLLKNALESLLGKEV